MKSFPKFAAGAMLLLLTLLLAVKALLFWQAWEYRRRAEQLLSWAKTLQPGVSTVAALASNGPAAAQHFLNKCEENAAVVERDGLEVYNWPRWKLVSGERVPSAIWAFEVEVLLPKWTMFEVGLSCQAGVLTEVRVSEMQALDGSPHPFSDTTTLLSRGIAANASAIDQQFRQRAYWIYERGSVSYVGDKVVWRSPMLNRFVFVTPEATAEERQKALDFHLNCFTRVRGCQDVNLILNPAPSR